MSYLTKAIFLNVSPHALKPFGLKTNQILSESSGAFRADCSPDKRIILSLLVKPAYDNEVPDKSPKICFWDREGLKYTPKTLCSGEGANVVRLINAKPIININTNMYLVLNNIRENPKLVCLKLSGNI